MEGHVEKRIEQYVETRAVQGFIGLIVNIMVESFSGIMVRVPRMEFKMKLIII